MFILFIGCQCVYHDKHVEVRGQLEGDGSLFPLCGEIELQGLRLGGKNLYLEPSSPPCLISKDGLTVYP